MGLKVDKFTWTVIAIVLLVLIAAVVTVNVSGERGWGEPSYLEENIPEAPVHNAFVALQLGEISKAREQYSQRVLENAGDERRAGPLGTETYYDNERTARRLRIISVEMDAQDPDRAFVTYVTDTYRNAGLFDGSSTWSSRRLITVVRENGVWKIDTDEYFY